MFKKIIYLFVFLTFCLSNKKSEAQSVYFPPIIGNTWDTLSFTELNWCDDSLQNLLNYVGDNDSKAFIVLKNGKIVIEKYYGSFTKDSLWYWASAGKSLTSVLVGIAQEKNFLSINDSSSKYIGENFTSCADADEGKIKVIHQLKMTSGLNDIVFDKDCTEPICLNCLTAPDTRWAYHNAPYTLLDKVIENSSSMSLNVFCTSYLKSKIGMGGLYIKQGYNNVYVSNARSMARFGLLAMNNFIWNTDTVLGDQNYKTAMTNSSQNLNQAYGYLWWLNGKSSFMLPSSQLVFNGPLLPNAPSDLFSGLGKNGQIVNVVPSQKIVVIRMGDAPLNGQELPMIFNNEIWKKLNYIICNSTTVEQNKINDLKIYPNPSNNIFNIESSEEIQSIKLYNSLGQELALSISNNQIDLQQYPAGIYRVLLITKNNASTRTLVLNSK